MGVCSFPLDLKKLHEGLQVLQEAVVANKEAMAESLEASTQKILGDMKAVSEVATEQLKAQKKGAIHQVKVEHALKDISLCMPVIRGMGLA